MVYIKVLCPHCGSDDIVLHGKNTNGKQRLLCRNPECSHKTFQLDYAYNACEPDIKQQIIDMAMNGSGTRDTGRVLNVSKDTVTSVLKKQKNSQSKLMKNTFNSGVEILPDLKKKYPSYLKPDFHSIKITHNDGIVYLESVRYRRSDFKDEIIERIDLGFIINGTSEMLFLASRNPEDNARLFVHQLDEYSMINCTYLFTHEACVEIAQRHERG